MRRGCRKGSLDSQRRRGTAGFRATPCPNAAVNGCLTALDVYPGARCGPETRSYPTLVMLFLPEEFGAVTVETVLSTAVLPQRVGLEATPPLTSCRLMHLVTQQLFLSSKSSPLCPDWLLNH